MSGLHQQLAALFKTWARRVIESRVYRRRDQLKWRLDVCTGVAERREHQCSFLAEVDDAADRRLMSLGS